MKPGVLPSWSELGMQVGEKLGVKLGEITKK